MWRKVLFGVILCVRILSVVQQETSHEDADVCSHDSKGYRFCQSENAICRKAPEHPNGYECVCQKGKVKVGDFCIEQTTMARTTPFTESTSTSSPLSSSVSLTSDVENTPSETSDVSHRTNYSTSTTSQPTPVSLFSSVSLTTLNKSHLGLPSPIPVSGTLDWPMSAKVTTASLACLVVILSSISIYLLYRYIGIRKSQPLEKNKVVFQKGNECLHTDSMDTLVNYM